MSDDRFVTESDCLRNMAEINKALGSLSVGFSELKKSVEIRNRKDAFNEGFQQGQITSMNKLRWWIGILIGVVTLINVLGWTSARSQAPTVSRDELKRILKPVIEELEE